MNFKEKNLEFQIQLWALAGPVIALLTTAILLIKRNDDATYFAWVLFAGILISWRWKTKGLLAALGGLTLFASYPLLLNISIEWMWHSGIITALALTFLVTALSYEEVEGIITGIQQESSSRLKSLLKLDEKLDSVQTKMGQEKQQLSIALQDRDKQLLNLHKLLEITKDDLITSHGRQENLLTTFYDHQRSVSNPEVEEESPSTCPATDIEKLEADLKQSYLLIAELKKAQREMDYFQESRKWEGRYKQLQEQFEEKNSVLEATRRDLFQTQEKLSRSLLEKKERSYDLTDTEKELQRCLKEMEDEYAEWVKHNQSEVEQLQSIVADLVTNPPRFHGAKG